MFSLKKIVVKRKLKKNVKGMQNAVKKAFRVISKDMNKRVSSMKSPIKITLTR